LPSFVLWLTDAQDLPVTLVVPRMLTEIASCGVLQSLEGPGRILVEVLVGMTSARCCL